MRMKPCLTASDVHKIAAACRTEAQRNSWNVTIAIADDAGILLYLERMDGAAPNTAEVAMMKARGSALTRKPTKFWESRVAERPSYLNFPNVLQIEGGVPILHQGECVGAIGISGVQPHFDDQIAQAGIQALT